MATTTAAVTLTSDLMSANISVSASTTLMKAGTTADGLDMIDYGVIDIVTGDQFDIFDADDPSGSPIAGVLANKANKVYIANHSTDETYYVDIMIDAQAVGKLYAGDWMFIPWNASDDDAEVELEAINGAQVIEYAWFNNDFVLTTAAS